MEALILFNPTLILIGSLFLIFALFLFLVRRHYRAKNRRLPFTQGLLRAPGQSLLKEIDALSEEIALYAVYLFLGPLTLYSAYISWLYFGRKPLTPFDLGLLALTTAAMIGFSLLRMAKRMPQRRRKRLGYDGEVAVGQALNELIREGYYIYHDVPADGFNIDHVVVGPQGVFAVETKARSKPNGKNRLQDATVEYNGRVLYFPQGTDTRTIAQAEKQAKWLSSWIGSAVGEPVAVRAIVALPGWFVKRTSADGISVVNPKQFGSLFKHIQPRSLSGEAVQRVVHQLEQKCRDVDPLPAVYELKN